MRRLSEECVARGGCLWADGGGPASDADRLLAVAGAAIAPVRHDVLMSAVDAEPGNMTDAVLSGTCLSSLSA